MSTVNPEYDSLYRRIGDQSRVKRDREREIDIDSYLSENGLKLMPPPKTHCRNGHPYTDADRVNGGRHCRKCHHLGTLASRARRMAAK